MLAVEGNGTLSIIQGATSGISGTATLANGLPTALSGTPVSGTEFNYVCKAKSLSASGSGEEFALTK